MIKTRRPHSLRLLTLCAALLFASVPALADMSQSEAAAKAQQMYGGKVLSVEKVSSDNGKAVFRVKLLLPDGKVKVVTIRE